MILRVDDKDSVKQAVSFWITELGELDDTFKKSGASALKAFLTQDNDVLRRAYARKESSTRAALFLLRLLTLSSILMIQLVTGATGRSQRRI